MATRWDPTSTNYTAQMLQGGTGPTSTGDWTKPWTTPQMQQGGQGQGQGTLTPIQRLQQAGITMGDLQNLGLLGPPQMNTPVQNWGSGGQSGVGGGGTIGGQVIDPASRQLQQQNATLLRLMLQGDQPQQQQNQPPTWNQVGQAAGLSPADISQFQTLNRTPADIAQRFSVLGPQFAGLSPQQFQVPQQVVPTPVTGQTVVPTAQPVKRFQTGGLVTGNWDWPKVAQAAGLSQADLTTFQQQGLTPDQAAQRFGLGASPPQPISQGQPVSQGVPSTGTTSQMMKSGGAMAGKAAPTDQELFSNPMYAANALGAAALQMPMVVNPQPSGQPSAKSGVADVPKAIVSQGAPIVPGQQPSWDQVALASGLSSNDIAELQKTGLAPADAARKFGLNLTIPQPQEALAGPWSTQPGVFVKAATPTPTATTPLQAAAQPIATAYSPTATPFATPPAAPSMPAPLLAAHTSGLEDAGKAIFAHFGGDPNTATPAHVTDFHNQLLAATGALAAAPQPTAAKKMRSGGLVPGRGNRDTVPALLTPGEYVIPKDQVPGYLKMADGGVVPENDPNAPPEARRQRLTTAAAQSSQAPPAAPGGGSSSSYSSLTSGLTTAAHTYANSLQNSLFGAGGPIPRGSTAGAGAYGTVGSLMAGQGSAGAAGSLGKLPAGGGLQSALGGIGSGLTQAAQAIASSVHPWQMQQSAIPAPPPAPAAPQFTQPPASQQTQQGLNPYAAYAANQAMYPTSPYYT